MAKTPKAPKPTKEKKPRKPKAAPVSTVAGSNSIDRDQQNLARHHRDKYIMVKAALNKTQRAMQALGKVIKADGLTMRQIKLMADLMTPEGEAAFKAGIAADLLAARWQGAEIGAQMEMFMEPNRTPAVDQAYEMGVQDCMDGKTPKSPFDPSLPQSQNYLKGYHDETERRVKAGIGSDVKPNPTRAETLAAARAKNEVPSPPSDKFN